LIQGFEQYTRADVVKIASKELGIAASVELVPDVDDGLRHPASLLGTSTLHPSLPIDCTFIPKSKPFLAICLKRAILMTHRLISLGYKVGVISQMETAALKKVGENRNAPFTRELTHLFTAATYVQPSHLTASLMSPYIAMSKILRWLRRPTSRTSQSCLAPLLHLLTLLSPSSSRTWEVWRLMTGYASGLSA